MRYLILCLMLTACAEPGGTAQPVSHDSVPTGSQNLGASAPQTITLSNRLIGQIQRLSVGSAELQLSCPGGLCAPIPESRLECHRGTSIVLSYESPEYCFLIPGQAAP